MTAIYKFLPSVTGQPATCVNLLSDNAFVPFDQANDDFVQFLTDWKNGATVTNADGSPASYADWVAAGNPAAPS